MRCFALLAVLACANALVVNTLPARSAVAARAAAPAMLEPTSVDAASQLIAGLAIPVPALTPAKVRAAAAPPDAGLAANGARRAPRAARCSLLTGPRPAAAEPCPPSPPQSAVMMTANMATIVTMSVQGKSILKGLEEDGFRGARKAHEEMVDMLGITWLLSGTAFGHVLGAGAILGMSASGIL